MSARARGVFIVVVLTVAAVAVAIPLTRHHRRAADRSAPNSGISLSSLPSATDCGPAKVASDAGRFDDPLVTVDAYPVRVLIILWWYRGTATPSCARETISDRSVAAQLAAAVRSAPPIGGWWYGAHSCPPDRWDAALYFVYERQGRAEYIGVAGCGDSAIGAPDRAARSTEKLNPILYRYDRAALDRAVPR